MQPTHLSPHLAGAEDDADDLGFAGNPDYLPGSIEQAFPGHLIVIEGPDGSGRSTQLTLLAEWLEWRGFAVKTIGLKRSKVLSKDLDDLTRSNEMHLMTQVLLQALGYHHLALQQAHRGLAWSPAYVQPLPHRLVGVSS